jgi:hypothetical protein
MRRNVLDPLKTTGSFRSFALQATALEIAMVYTLSRARIGRQAAINATAGELPSNLLNPPIYRKINPADGGLC